MTAPPHCPSCKASISLPKERVMPDQVVEYRCPSCAYQLPLLAPGRQEGQPCPECAADPPLDSSLSAVDSSGLLNLLFCGSCGCLLGRYWGIMDL